MRLNRDRVIKKWSYAENVIPLKEGFRPNGYGRRFAKQDEHPLLLTAFKEFGLTPKAIEPVYKIFTGNHYLDGAYTHKHTDTTVQGYVHARCNLMIKKPLEGGDPVIDDEKLDVEEGDLWLCLASEEEHASTPIKGGERIIVSFGGLVPREQFKEIITEISCD